VDAIKSSRDANIVFTLPEQLETKYAVPLTVEVKSKAKPWKPIGL
jgi:hypothetical protein